MEGDGRGREHIHDMRMMKGMMWTEWLVVLEGIRWGSIHTSFISLI